MIILGIHSEYFFKYPLNFYMQLFSLQILCKTRIYFFLIQEDFVNDLSFSILLSRFNCEIIYLNLLLTIKSLIMKY